MATTDQPVLVRVEGRLGHLTLNRPQRINALGQDMIQLVHRALDRWAVDPDVELVLIDGAGSRGLCAGGDIKEAYQTLVGPVGCVGPGNVSSIWSGLVGLGSGRRGVDRG